ncbi:Vesicle transport v-SNARE protein vti1 [Psilocybe cubensis]|uniref:Vesicle transport v-SNARE protein vti1 n=1 Tax=Psilocybe cubensis TaxID=181762 RepID=A0ACB8H531_PSICU|nr:Vesicle transport v-SNARE protein vti1 [Psilocybe cubensis]KAH9482812.1 Vesicle transport v-SNARE protein vti1 [Psilocybe cubensis]
MDTSPTALFDSYEQDFLQFIETIHQKLDVKDGTDKEQRKASLRRVEMELDEADEMVPTFESLNIVPDMPGHFHKVSQMEIEIQGIPQSVRAQYQSRLRSAKAELSKHKKLLVDSRAQLARMDLLSSANNPGGYSSSDDPYGPSSDRTRLLAGTALLEEGSKRLQQSQQIALETENQGADILMNLRTQREQIENSRNTRAVTYSIIGVLMLLIVVIIWEKLSG